MQHFFTNRKYGLHLLTLLLAFTFGCTPKKNNDAADALSGFTIPEEFKIELFASEPLVADPVDMEIDEEGRVYVVEMHGYPLDTKGSGKIKILKDTNYDGLPDKSILFADQLVLPTSIMRWKKGVLVTDAPDIIYLEDSDGDDIADIRKIVMTGFARSNPQHNLNSPVYGMDNWIYLAHESAVHTVSYDSIFGDKGTRIHFTDHQHGQTLPQNANGKSIRFKPDMHQMEMLSSHTQYGHSFDKWGRYFLSGNSTHIYQEAIAQRYTDRNPQLLSIPSMAYIAEHGNAAEVYPATTNAEHQLLTDVGVFTSACGITIYNGGLFPAQYDGVSFVAEPVHNLVHADRIENDGPVQKAIRLFGNKEFLTSTDPWFRPVNFYVGPDGALYVVDYYRKIIEHPEWLSDEVNQSGQLYAGTDQGRIYRIVPKNRAGSSGYFGKKLLDHSKSSQLVDHLADSNYWWRINAQRLLVDTKPTAVIPSLETLIEKGNIETTQIHALWTLEGMDKLNNDILLAALQSGKKGLLLNAIQLAETKLKDPRLEAALINLSSSDQEIRFKLLLALGNSITPAAVSRGRKLLFEDPENKWMQLAALTAGNLNSAALWEDLALHFSKRAPSTVMNEFFARLGSLMVMQGQYNKIEMIISNALSSESSGKAIILPTITGIISGPDNEAKQIIRKKLRPFISQIIPAFERTKDAGEIALMKSLILFLAHDQRTDGRNEEAAKLTRLIVDKSISPEKRAAALEVRAAIIGNDNDIDYTELIHPWHTIEVQRTALQLMSGQEKSDSGFASFVIHVWQRLTPELRNEAVNLLMINNTRIEALLEAVAKNIIPATAIGWRRSVRLMTNDNIKLKNKARELLDQFSNESDQTAAKFEGIENSAGDPKSGLLVFEKNCAVCHQVDTKWGKTFGPDLSSIRNQSKKSILIQILDPNKAIADGYGIWRIKTASGETIEGIIADESTNAIVIKSVSEEEFTIDRDKIISISSSSISGMPEGLGNQISKEEMGHLLEFLKNFNRIN